MTAVVERPAPIVEVPALAPRRAAVAWVALGLSVLSLWSVAFALLLSSTQEHSAQSRLYATFREQLAGGTAPLGPVAPGRPVALVASARLHLSAVVVEGTAGRDLATGPGHRRDTVLPGQAGVSVLFGRASTYGGPLADLATLRPGDELTATTAQGVFRYRVEGLRRNGDPLPIPVTGAASRLTLESLEGDGWRSGWAAQHPLFVDALLLGKSAAPVARVAGLPAAEAFGGHDSSGLVVLVAWLQGLVLVVAGTVWGATRWGLWQSWLVGVPAILAVLWGAAGAALPLLPNVL